MTMCSELGTVKLTNWLEALHLEQYLEKILDAGILSLEDCENFDEELLTNIGVTLPGHKRRILSHLPKNGTYTIDDRRFSVGEAAAEPVGSAQGDLDLDDVYENVVFQSGALDEDDHVYGNVSFGGDPDSIYDTPPPPLPSKKGQPKQDLEEKFGIKQFQLSKPNLEAIKGLVEHNGDSLYENNPAASSTAPLQEPLRSNSPLGKRPIPRPRVTKEPKHVEGSPKRDADTNLNLPVVTGGSFHSSSPKPVPRPRSKKTKSDQHLSLAGVTSEESTDQDSTEEVHGEEQAAAGMIPRPESLLNAVPPAPVRPAPPVLPVRTLTEESVLDLNSNSLPKRTAKPNEYVGSPTREVPERKLVSSDSVDSECLYEAIWMSGSPEQQQGGSTAGSSDNASPSPEPPRSSPVVPPMNAPPMNPLSASPALPITLEPSKTEPIQSSSAAPCASPITLDDLSMFDPLSHSTASKPVPFRAAPTVPSEQSSTASPETKNATKNERCAVPKRPPPPLCGAAFSKEASTESNTDNRASTMSFDEPPPCFTPPPLPPGYTPAIPPFPGSSKPKVPPRRLSESSPTKMSTQVPVFHYEDIGSVPKTPGFSDLAKGRAHSDSFGFESDMFTPPPRSTNRRPTDLNITDPFIEDPFGPLEPPVDPFSSPIYDQFSATESPTTPKPLRTAPPPPPRQGNPFEHFRNKETGLYEFKDDDFDEVESEGTLSDGGEFYSDMPGIYPPSPTIDRSRIPITSAALTHSIEKRGYLMKQGGKQGNKGWRRRWVAFNGVDLRYMTSEKSTLTKRIVPVAAMKNVENCIKQSETKPYKFRLYTIDRVYLFAADTLDEMKLWTSALMEAILNNQQGETFFKAGGDMHHPDKEAFVRMDGITGKTYIALKGGKFCYYKSYDDYRVGSPIHEIEMKLASVKDLGKNRVQVLTHYCSYIMTFDSSLEGQQWVETLREAIEEAVASGMEDDYADILQEVYSNDSNKYCADCDAPDPHWASINLGIVICKKCAGVHRFLSLPLSKTRSLKLDRKVWSTTILKLLTSIGNSNANNFWDWNCIEAFKINPDSSDEDRKAYIIDKYKNKTFTKFHPLQGDKDSLNEALCKAVQYDSITETMQLLFSGADILCSTSAYGTETETPLQLARNAGQMLQAEFLYQNGAEGSGELPNTADSGAASKYMGRYAVAHKGFLYKTGPDNREYLHRWCVLEHGILSYYQDDKTPQAKNSIQVEEMTGVSIGTPDDRFEYVFELFTTKDSFRVYQFAAESEAERAQWMKCVAQSLVYKEVVERVPEMFDRAGVLFVREGATGHWQDTWLLLNGKKMLLSFREDKKTEEIDLRKITSITLSDSQGCPEAAEHGLYFIIDLPGRALYIQCNTVRDTEGWWKLVNKAATEGGDSVWDQQLTAEDVPVLVEKCITYISIHGLDVEGIFRLNGSHLKIKTLLEAFSKDARSIHLRPDQYEVHDVANVLKRFLRNLVDPLLTQELHAKWISTAAVSDHNSKMQWYKYRLGQLPTVNYNTLKKILGLLVTVAEHETSNKMSVINLASIFGPVLMNSDVGNQAGFDYTNYEISTLVDLITYFNWLFEVSDAEKIHDRKIQEALEKIKQAQNHKCQAGDIIMGVYIGSNQGDCCSVKVPAQMSGQELISTIVKKGKLEESDKWAVFEVICQGELERPLHYSERVLEVTLRWSTWGDEFCKDNYLCIKHNYLYEKLDYVFDPTLTLFSELRYSERKPFRKFCFEFSQSRLSYQKDTKASSPLGSFDVEDITIYIGAEHKRLPPTRWCFTFIVENEKIAKSKDAPYFGRCVSCGTEEDLYRWLAGMIHAQHGEGLTPSAGDTNLKAAPSITHKPLYARSRGSPEKSSKSFIKRILRQ